METFNNENIAKHDRMKKLFPLASNNHKMKKRSAEKFKVHFAHTNRYRKSAIPFMHDLLNKDAKKIQKILS